jgi:hypothetical protein
MPGKTRRKQKKPRPVKLSSRRRPGKTPVRTRRAVKSIPNSSKRSPAKRADVIEMLVAANAQALLLSIDPAWRAGVARNLQLLLAHATLVDQFSLPDEAEPAPVFRA